MKNLAEYVTESILDSTHSGKNYVFTKEELSKDLANLFYEIFGDIVKYKGVQAFSGPDFDIKNIKLDPIDSKDDKKLLRANRSKLVKELLPRMKKFYNEFGKKYEISKETIVKKPNTRGYIHLSFEIESNIKDWDSNFKVINFFGFYSYDEEKNKPLNTLMFSSRDLDTLDKYLTK